ncbi:MAG: prephenate dehydratase [Proteobacteria bacterium]|nr:prephenate dehydratase [Pseudomonadota bacterium]
MKVAFQGVRGAYSEEAALAHFGKSCVPAGYALSEQAVDAVERGTADFGILPVENSIAGHVAVNSDLFLNRRVTIIGESYLAIRHCLLARPESTLAQLDVVYSHPVALAQCETFLKRRKLVASPEYDTAGAAERVAERGQPGDGAIASERCAAIYGLQVLKRDIQSVRHNITRFLVFARHGNVPHGLKMQKTSVAFIAKHRPGALLGCLKRLADHGINLTRLESRPIPENPFAYVFLVDLVGGMKDEPVLLALKDLKKDARRVQVLGSYPAAARPK